MKTAFTIYYTNGTTGHSNVDWPEEPKHEIVMGLCRTFLSGEPIRVAITRDGVGCDLFMLHGDGPRNDKATAVLRDSMIAKVGNVEPEKLPEVRGRAMIFDRRVWAS